MDTQDPLALEGQVCFALAVASRSVIAAYRPVLEPLHLTHPQYLVMLALWEQSPVSLKEVSRLLRLDPGTLSPLAKRLESLGYIERQRDARDGRTLCITLSDRGRALRAEAEKVPGQMMERLGLSREELVGLHATMTKLITATDRLH
ncbi:MarR family winged helix-turn-helix transcriptional regulator [Arthrobacter sp. JSM 101049]|uniref:MarR family winged helix-turn-helix transcriptional regulator n=1 Tax=Arthrobacter sp. JSM 101049 TaxID=929097 RepID=UPI003568ACF6